MSFADIVGQDKTIAVLRNSLEAGRIAHAYLFDGIEGCGKRKTALALIAALFCRKSDEGCASCPTCRNVAMAQHPDLHMIEPDGAFIKIEQIRDLQRELVLRPFEAPRKACIIEAAERLNPSSGNALLKTLEEPPGNALIILLTTNIGGVLPTILSRCQRLHFPALPAASIERVLLRRGCTPETARVAASLGGGSLKKATEIGEEETLVNRREFLERVFSLSLGDIAPLFAAAEEIAAEKDKALEMLELLTSFLRDVLLRQEGIDSSVNSALHHLLDRQAAALPPGKTLEQIDAVREAHNAILRNANPRLALEVLFMRLAQR